MPARAVETWATPGRLRKRHARTGHLAASASGQAVTTSRVVSAFCVLTASSVSMTLGNKWLMMQPELRPHSSSVAIVQNSIAVVGMALAALSGAVRISPITRLQLLYYTWDALVLAVQLWTSFKALQYLSVPATTVCRSLAVPAVAWLELVVLGTSLDTRRHICGWLVVAGAVLYAADDLVTVSAPVSGYLWAGANLLAFCSNSVLDKIFMSSLPQTASGMAMLTQLISIPISLAQGLLFEPAAASASPLDLLRALDGPSACALLLTGALAALLGHAYATCYQCASATAVTVAGNVNKVVAILLSAAVFGGRATRVQVAGMALCLGAATLFSLAAVRAKKA